MAPFGASRAGLMSVSGDAIPDSEADQKLIHRWVLDDVNSTVEDSIGDADGTNNGVASVDGNWSGSSAGEGNGVDDFIETTTLGDFGQSLSGDFAIAFSFQTDDENRKAFFGSFQDSGPRVKFSVRQRGREGNPDDINLFLQDDNDDIVEIETEQSFSNGEKYRAVINSSGSGAGDKQIWVNQSEESFNTITDDGVSMDNLQVPMYIFGQNFDGSLDEPFDGRIDDVCFFDDSLTQSEIESYQNPFS